MEIKAAEISSIIQEISNSVDPKPDDSHLDNLIQQVIKIVDEKAHEENMQSKDKPSSKKAKEKNKKTKPKKWLPNLWFLTFDIIYNWYWIRFSYI